MRLLLVLLTAFLAPLSAKEDKAPRPHRLDFGFFGPGAVNAKHNPLFFSTTFNDYKDRITWGRILEARPGCPASAPKVPEKPAPAADRTYLVVCVERNGVKTYPVVDQARLKEKVEQNRDARVATAAGPFQDRKEAEQEKKEKKEKEEKEKQDRKAAEEGE